MAFRADVIFAVLSNGLFNGTYCERHFQSFNVIQFSLADIWCCLSMPCPRSVHILAHTFKNCSPKRLGDPARNNQMNSGDSTARGQ